MHRAYEIKLSIASLFNGIRLNRTFNIYLFIVSLTTLPVAHNGQLIRE
jgi:hypothetical protein